MTRRTLLRAGAHCARGPDRDPGIGPRDRQPARVGGRRLRPLRRPGAERAAGRDDGGHAAVPGQRHVGELPARAGLDAHREDGQARRAHRGRGRPNHREDRSVTWSGGEIKPGEFQEFGISFQVPEDAADRAWCSRPSRRIRAARSFAGSGTSRRTSRLRRSPCSLRPPRKRSRRRRTRPPPRRRRPTRARRGDAAAATDDDGEDDDGQATLALVLSIVALLLGGGALAYALFRPRRTAA